MNRSPSSGSLFGACTCAFRCHCHLVQLLSPGTKLHCQVAAADHPRALVLWAPAFKAALPLGLRNFSDLLISVLLSG